MTEFHNPTPVVVALIGVHQGDWLGLLTIRRAIPPVGKIALPGGFLEIEPWRDGLSREVLEETGVGIEPVTWNPVAFASSFPNPNRLLCFAETYFGAVDELPPFVPNSEVLETGIVYLTEGLEDEIAYPLHFDQIREWLDGTDNRRNKAPAGFHPLR